MINKTYISDTLSGLKKEVNSYLKDAGFKNDSYKIVSYDDREYLSVYMSEKAIDYIVKDVLKSDWKNILEIKKYEDLNCSAIFIFKF